MAISRTEIFKPIKPVIIGGEAVDLRAIYRMQGEKTFPFSPPSHERQRNRQGVTVWVKDHVLEPQPGHLDIEVFPTDEAVNPHIFFRAYTHSRDGLRTAFFSIRTKFDSGDRYEGFPLGRDLVALSWDILNVPPVEQIVSQWWETETEDNYRTYRQLRGQGLTGEEAALGTWSGINIAQRHSFFNATVEEGKQGYDGRRYTEVIYSK